MTRYFFTTNANLFVVMRSGLKDGCLTTRRAFADVGAPNEVRVTVEIPSDRRSRLFRIDGHWHYAGRIPPAWMRIAHLNPQPPVGLR